MTSSRINTCESWNTYMAEQTQNRSFEQALTELETRVRKLDEKGIPLETSLNLFEEGVKLVRECQQLLDQAEHKIIELMQGPDGIQEVAHQAPEESNV